MPGPTRHVALDRKRFTISSDTSQQTVALTQLFSGNKQAFSQFLEQDLERAYDFARRELEYHDALNKLTEHEVDPHDIVNQAVAELLSAPGDAPLRPGQRLYRTILDVVHQQVAALEERERREVSIDANVQDPATQGGFKTLGEHVLYFWQPDQDLTQEDVLADTEVPTPAEILDMKERQHELYAALDALPRRWRESFVLFAIERWKLADIAQLHGMTEDQVKVELRATQQFLLARLRDRQLATNRTPRSTQPPIGGRGGA